MTEFAIVRAPALKMPPPSVAEPPVMVRPLMPADAPGVMRKTWKALLPLTEITLAPGPWIVVVPDVSVSDRPADVSTIVPDRPGAKLIVSAPAVVLAEATAARRLPAPESFRLVTVKVAGARRSS